MLPDLGPPPLLLPPLRRVPALIKSTTSSLPPYGHVTLRGCGLKVDSRASLQVAARINPCRMFMHEAECSRLFRSARHAGTCSGPSTHTLLCKHLNSCLYPRLPMRTGHTLTEHTSTPTREINKSYPSIFRSLD
jgi:hypothetical protein